MKQTMRATWEKYAASIGIELLIAFLVAMSKGFFGESASVNVQILADSFFVPGVLMTLFAGMMFISGEGALIGISFVLRNVVLAFIPMGRAKHEAYADYRARKLTKTQKSGIRYVLLPGLAFLVIGIALSLYWSVAYYGGYSM